MGWLIAAAVIAALLLLPIGLSAKYDSDGAAAALILGPIKPTVYPFQKDKPAKTEQSEEKKSTVKTDVKKQSGGSVTDFIPLVRLILKLLTDFRTKLRVNCLELNVILAGNDPCDLAVNYGKACAALGNFWPHLERFFIIKKRDVKLQCDFEALQTVVTARLHISITVGRILLLVMFHGTKILKEFFKIYKIRKGGSTS